MHGSYSIYSGLQDWWCQLDPQACQHGSQRNSGSGCVCDCEPGFEGDLCNVETDECDSMPCAHGNCTDLVNGFECTCYEGFEGLTCSLGMYVHVV